jgi:bifunctional non-homologous end joining protein LigD
MHDVLKSWAVPKGPPYELDQARLAMPTEDHPMDYLEFEGIIPKGQYGGGTVMVWDIGTYELIEGNYYKGYLRIDLDGTKLKGEWTLRRSREEGREVWYLTKTGESTATPKREDRSAASGRTMEEIARKPAATWHSNRSTPDPANLPAAHLEFIPPMLAKLTAKLPEGPEWTYEIKLDGYRAIALKKGKSGVLFSRLGNKMNGRFPSPLDGLAKLPEGTMLDGEVVALDKEGRPSFHSLQQARGDTGHLFYYAFDILSFQSKDTRNVPLSDRRLLLTQALDGLTDPIRISAPIEANVRDLLKAARDQGLEGIIAKRLNSPYEPGDRSGAWVKCKTAPGQEMIIGGYLPGKDGFESLLVGYRTVPNGPLLFIGKVRNGFTPAIRQEVAAHFPRLETDVCPFSNLPEPKNARRGEALTAEAMKRYHWLKPGLVAQIAFTEWTEGNHLRHSRFEGLRDDKSAAEVVREIPV